MHGRRAFTLIELLVVIGIIGVLVTILLPALAGITARAYRVVCQQNLHAVVVANTSYAEYNRQHYLLAAADMADDNLERWFGVREDTNSPFEWGGPFAEYLPGGNIKPCPAFRNFDESAGQDEAFEAGCGGYGYNELYIGGRFGLYRNAYANTDNSRRGYGNSAAMSDVASSSQTVMFADAAFSQAGGALIAYSFTHAPKWIPAPPYGGGRANPPIHFRHQGLANVGWMDGHASAEPMTYSQGYTTHSEISADEAANIGLGWFGDYHENLPDANYLFDLD